jgi:hypothetical protein
VARCTAQKAKCIVSNEIKKAKEGVQAYPAFASEPLVFMNPGALQASA